MYTVKKIKNVLNEYFQLKEKIDYIVELHGKKDECCYEIVDIEVYEGGLGVSLEFYKWQDTNFHNIFIDYDLLTDSNALHKLEKNVENKINARKKKEEQEKAKKEQEEIEKAQKLLKEKGLL